MKKILIFLLLLGALGACKKDEPVIKDQLSLLPPATQRGANTGGCLVDGEAFLPNNESVLPLVCHYLDGQDFSFSVSKKVNGRYYSVRVIISKTRLEIGKTYQLNEKFGYDTNTGEYIISSASTTDPRYYATSPNTIGEVTITAHNFNRAFLSGTFWFDAINSEGEIVKIRKGRFDMDY